MTDVTCSQARELVSARIDGESDAADDAVIDRHIETCPTCRSYEQDAYALRRTLRMSEVVPDTADKPAIDVGSLRTVSIMRAVLFVIGGTLVILNVSSIVSPESTAAEHLSRHNGVFGTALGIGMLAVAAKPHRAIGLVPLTSTIAVLMAVAATTDLMSGKANLLSEASHVVEFAGLICLWVISGGPSRVPHHLEAITRRLPMIFSSTSAPLLEGPKRLP